MTQIAKLLFYLFRELIFDNKDEFDIKSKKFNTRKFIVLILVTMSFVINLWLVHRFFIAASDISAIRKELQSTEPACQAEINLILKKSGKKPLSQSSDSR